MPNDTWTGHPIVWVRWEDAAFVAAHGDEWDKTVLTDSVGILLASNSRFVKIAQTAYPPEYYKKDSAERLTIPRSMVKFVKILTIKEE